MGQAAIVMGSKESGSYNGQVVGDNAHDGFLHGLSW